MKRYIRAAQIIPNKKIQKGLVWHIDWHEFTCTYVSPDHRTCKITEEWVSEDTGEDCKDVETYKIGKDSNGNEFAYLPEYESEINNDRYWWIKKYASGADNYPYFDEEDAEDYMSDEIDEEYTPPATAGDYSPSNPWDAPGMSIHDFI